MAHTPTLVTHTIEPLFDSRSRVLMLGTMPSPKSREYGFYYGHPRNRFWPVMACLWDEPPATTIAEKKALMLRHRLAVWDVLAGCEIVGASDASIKRPRPNDLARIIDAAPIEAVVTCGSAATRHYERFDAPRWPELPHLALPSTSPANARMSLDALVKAYAPVKELAEGGEAAAGVLAALAPTAAAVSDPEDSAPGVSAPGDAR